MMIVAYGDVVCYIWWVAWENWQYGGYEIPGKFAWWISPSL